MLNVLEEFRKTLSDAMVPCLGKHIVLYGYGYTGIFLRWYAKYYHGIEVDYVISTNNSRGIPYDQELFAPTLFDFGFKDVPDAVIWLAVPYEGQAKALLEREGYPKERIVDFYSLVYGDDLYWPDIKTDPFHQRKTGLRDVQFLEWLEWKYDCNFVTRVENKDFETIEQGKGASFVGNTQKEIFEIMDHIHYRPEPGDAILDIGCGKGGAMLSFLDYGFPKVGGAEYEPGLVEVLQQNLKHLALSEAGQVVCFSGDASALTRELDDFNWFYLFSPFYGELFEACIGNIIDSLKRKPRKVRVIYANPHEQHKIGEKKEFRLVNQFTFQSRQRVVKVYESC